jgi:hypothetical protein
MFRPLRGLAVRQFGNSAIRQSGNPKIRKFGSSAFANSAKVLGL